MSSPLLISLSRSQQNPCFAVGPDSLDAPFLGSFDGSGNEARCVGGGEPEAADIWLDGPRDGVGEDISEKRDEVEGFTPEGIACGLMGLDGAGDAEGDDANGFILSGVGSAMTGSR
jgi:hypothetical protein